MLGMLLALMSTAPAQASGPRWLMAPLARAFGVPPEAELAKCREGFRRFQTEAPVAEMVLLPAFRIDREEGGGERGWSLPIAATFSKRWEAMGLAELVLGVDRSKLVQRVPPARMGHNQLRYLWERGAQYAQVLRDEKVDADYIWAIEVWAGRGKVAALQVYIFAADGQIVYLRAYNSHQFGQNLPYAGEAWMDFLITRLRQDLVRPPEEIFPRDGVG